MDITIAILLVLAGFAGGIINAVAGGATLVTFPVMLAAGLPPVIANASNAVAISPGHLIAAFADRAKLPPLDRRLAAALGVALAGGVMGALLLKVLPDRLFVLPVPALIGFATLLFAFAPTIQAWTERRRGGAAPSQPAGLAVLGGASVYGGFFGAGLGVILTAVLSIAEPNDIRKVKVVKNLLATAVSLAAIGIFIAQGMVRWPETLVMLSGALGGGYAGGALVRVLPGRLVQGLVIVAGAVMTIVYAWRYWF
ncbi:sulfite exporter TauE/SafE family protein [Phreatobacter stygius]|uniref:Probable membrane transporter protein n=1 Tax=Phreatobacter stygius TaxID=1940610 RepID=A0A4D7B8T6_9HYPH|nr:sulfite exporter TauE/SafE family protein [Phreatobacter stygius]QCI67335.1 sulfite exporter TauE/SafE family protein [Phreatobacter stygius]